MIAGKLALKAGLFKGLLVALAAAKKFVVAGVIALGAGAKMLWSRLRGERADEGMS